MNPLVALLLGWALADEALGFRTRAAASVIVSAVRIFSVRRRPPGGAPGVAGAPRPAYHDTP